MGVLRLEIEPATLGFGIATPPVPPTLIGPTPAVLGCVGTAGLSTGLVAGEEV